MLCKLIAIIIDRRLADSINFHEIMHGFKYHREKGKATLEDKILQYISGLHHEVLYEIFLYIHKAHDSLDQGNALKILEGYGVGPRVFILLT